MMLELLISDTCVVFENIKFHRACTVQRDRKLELVVMIQRGSGNFEVSNAKQLGMMDLCLVKNEFISC